MLSLKCKNGWLDKEGRVYIIFTIEEVMTALAALTKRPGKLLHELWRANAVLIERKRRGLGKPNLIYVKNFVDKDVITHRAALRSPWNHDSRTGGKSRFRSSENHGSRIVKITI